MVCGAGNCLLARIGPLTSGTGRIEATWVAALAAGTATVAAGTANDSAASPPTAATGRTVRAVTRMSADRPRDAARRPLVKHRYSTPLTTPGARTRVSGGHMAGAAAEHGRPVVAPAPELLSHRPPRKSIDIGQLRSDSALPLSYNVALISQQAPV